MGGACVSVILAHQRIEASTPPLAPVSSLAPLATLPNVLADGRGRRRRRRRLPQRHEHSAFVVTSRQKIRQRSCTSPL